MSKDKFELYEEKQNGNRTCSGKDDYIPNVGYVIGESMGKLYSTILGESDVVYTGDVHDACIYEHHTDAEIAIHVLKRDGIQEAGNYRIYKVVSTLTECGD